MEAAAALGGNCESPETEGGGGGGSDSTVAAVAGVAGAEEGIAGGAEEAAKFSAGTVVERVPSR
jgi:hypothetical protein